MPELLISEDAAESLDGECGELLILIAPEQHFLFTGAAEGGAEVGRAAAPVEYGIAVYAGRFGCGGGGGTRGDQGKDSFLSRGEDMAVLGLENWRSGHYGGAPSILFYGHDSEDPGGRNVRSLIRMGK